IFDRLQEAKVGKLHSGNCAYRDVHVLQDSDIPYACFSTPADLPYSADPEVAEYKERLEAYTGEPVDGVAYWSLTQYPFVYALVDAMTAAGTVEDTDAIIEELRGMKSDQHVVTLSIGDTGEA